MMKRVFALLALAAMAGVPATAQTTGAAPAGPTADEIIAKNIEARGGLQKLKSAQSVRSTGRVTFGQIEAPLVQEVKRPRKVRLEFTIQGMTIIQAYDGTTGWQIVPFQDSADPQPMSADELKAFEEEADIDGPLVDYKQKGSKVELEGKENVEGADCFKLKITRKNGEIQNYFIDVKSFLELKVAGKRIVQGTEVEYENSFGDYREVDGLIFPHAIDVGLKNNPQRQSVVFEKIEVNPAIDDARFKQPAAKPPAATPPGH